MIKSNWTLDILRKNILWICCFTNDGLVVISVHQRHPFETVWPGGGQELWKCVGQRRGRAQPSAAVALNATVQAWRHALPCVCFHSPPASLARTSRPCLTPCSSFAQFSFLCVQHVQHDLESLLKPAFALCFKTDVWVTSQWQILRCVKWARERLLRGGRVGSSNLFKDVNWSYGNKTRTLCT